MVPTDSKSEASSWETRQKTPREKSGRSAHNNSLFHPGPEGQTKTPHFRYFFTVLLEKRSETTEQPVQEDGEGAGSSAAPMGATGGTEESRASRQPSGAGDLVRRHEPRVPKGPERHSAIWPDHQVGDAAIVE